MLLAPTIPARTTVVRPPPPIIYIFFVAVAVTVVGHFISLAWVLRLLHSWLSSPHGWHLRISFLSLSMVTDHALHQEVPLPPLCHLNKGGEYIYIVAMEYPHITIVASSYHKGTRGTDLTPTQSESTSNLFLSRWSYNQIFHLTRRAPLRLYCRHLNVH